MAPERLGLFVGKVSAAAERDPQLTSEVCVCVCVCVSSLSPSLCVCVRVCPIDQIVESLQEGVSVASERLGLFVGQVSAAAERDPQLATEVCVCVVCI